MKIRDITHAEEILQGFVPNARQYAADGLSLERMWPLLERAGNPHQSVTAIHVAGTSGKTSTCYYTAALLQASGKRVGLTVSPHVDSVTERVQIDGQPLSEEAFCQDLGEFLDLVADVENPSYFELLMVFILWEFVRYEVDYAVLETGLGGLLDSTNVVTRKVKVCVITDIGLDHMNMLGDTVEEIATQKAGIIHEHNQVFCYQQDDNIMQPIQARVHEKKATLSLISEQEFAKNLQIAAFQQRNFHLAEHVCQFVAQRDGFHLAKLDPLSVVVPGRMETKKLAGGSVLIMDGAHNGQKVQTFVDSFQAQYPGQTAQVLLALKKGKEYIEVIDALAPITQELIVTTFSTSQDLPAEALDPQILAEYAQEKGVTVTVEPDQEVAYKMLLDTSAQIKLVIGSFYLLGQIRAI